MARTTILILTSALALVSSAATSSSGVSAAVKPTRWVGTMQGGVTNTEHFDSYDGTVKTDDRAETKGRFTFTLRVAANGKVTGTGKGSYVTATFHRDGTTAGVAFGCDVPVRAQPYRVSVTGKAVKGRLLLVIKLPDAEESNESTACGGDYEVTASRTNILDRSLELAGGRSLRMALRRGTLSRTRHSDYDFEDADSVPPGNGHGTSDHAWTLSLRRAG